MGSLSRASPGTGFEDLIKCWGTPAALDCTTRTASSTSWVTNDSLRFQLALAIAAAPPGRAQTATFTVIKAVYAALGASQHSTHSHLPVSRFRLEVEGAPV